jgi:rare lipoprotein A (peptidoglycan hydrolase)
MRTTIGLSLALALVPAATSAKQNQAAHHDPTHSIKARHVRAAGDLQPIRAKRRRPAPTDAASCRARDAAHHTIARRERHATGRVITGREVLHSHQGRDLTRLLPAEDRYVGPLHVIGPREVGRAAWYGPRLLGDRTASGDRLDAIHATAAHRWLPLHSLVRITNLENGRTVVAEVNDRGPVSHSLIIDLSPRTARELHMIHQGIAHVVVVPVGAARKAGAVVFSAHPQPVAARRPSEPHG